MGLRGRIKTRQKGEILGGWRFAAFGFAIFFALAGCAALYMYVVQSEHTRNLANEGVDDTATIINKRTETSYDSKTKVSYVSRWILEYRFPLKEEGKTWDSFDYVEEALYDETEAGDQFALRYWPKDPDIGTILGDAYAAGAELARGLVFVLFGLATLLGLLVLVRPIRLYLDKGP